MVKAWNVKPISNPMKCFLVTAFASNEHISETEQNSSPSLNSLNTALSIHVEYYILRLRQVSIFMNRGSNFVHYKAAKS